MTNFLKEFAELRDKAIAFLDGEITKERFLLEGDDINTNDGFTDNDNEGNFLYEFYELPTFYVMNKHGMLYNTKVFSVFRNEDNILCFKSLDIETSDTHITTIDDCDWSTIIEVAQYFLPE